MEITVLNRQRAHPIDREALTRFLGRLVDELPPGEADRMGVCMVGDERMRATNRRFRGQNRTTDVLAFPGDGIADPDGGNHLGDILISVPQAASQAEEFGHPLRTEIMTLLIHGYLHLMGYDHERDEGEMQRLQRSLVRRLIAPEHAGRSG